MNFDEAFDRLIGHEGGSLVAAVQKALLNKSAQAASTFIPPANARDYVCEAPGCGRPGYAAGFCNAHYMRSRAGKSMEAPVRARKRAGECSECGKQANGKGGWGLCQQHYKSARMAAIKDALIEAMGGACSSCGGKFHRAVFDFHHVNAAEKGGNPSYLLANASPEAIASELAGCILLCANCHRMEHAK